MDKNKLNVDTIYFLKSFILIKNKNLIKVGKIIVTEETQSTRISVEYGIICYYTIRIVNILEYKYQQSV